MQREKTDAKDHAGGKYDAERKDLDQYMDP